MDWLISNWYIILGVVALVVVVGFSVYKFAGLPTKEQIAKIKEWLLLAVIEAERELGGGTGQIKLRYVYDLFVSKFPVVAKVVSFETFSFWVDDALDRMREMLEKNDAVGKLISGVVNR